MQVLLRQRNAYNYEVVLRIKGNEKKKKKKKEANKEGYHIGLALFTSTP
jgi:hypothetical protein